ncbi:uncharacterized protein LOC121382249 [Gigantopelta aegis]|uniref:uncharacterized protein LOC121382249 n=1 Tax=Gigantopelta aegis TaxID=1735272 RepID=UPI001B88A6CE|nr:uncharacterized protein LOC121382249 [Gigantopelta aegis]
MSDNSTSDGLSDWSVVSRDGGIETMEKETNSCDDLLKLSPDSVYYKHGHNIVEDGKRQDIAEDGKEHNTPGSGFETESTASSMQNLPAVLVESISGSIEEEMSSTGSSSSSDAAFSTTDLGFQEDGEVGALQGSSQSHALDPEQVRDSGGPVCFEPDSPESLRLQEHMAAQSSSLPMMQTIAVIQLSNTIDLSSDSDSDFVQLDQSSSEDSLYGDDPLQSEEQLGHCAAPAECISEPMEKSQSSVSCCFRFMPQEEGQEPVVHPDSDKELDEPDRDTTESAVSPDQINNSDKELDEPDRDTTESAGSPDQINNSDKELDEPDRDTTESAVSPDQINNSDKEFDEPDRDTTESAVSPDQINNSDKELVEADRDTTESAVSPDQINNCIEDAQSQSDVRTAAAAVTYYDTDQSSMNDLGDVPLTAGHVGQPDIQRPRRDNSWTLNGVGLLIVLVTVAFAIGHTIGSLCIHNTWIAGQQAKENELQHKLARLHHDNLQLRREQQERQEDNLMLKSELQFAESTVAVLQKAKEELKSRLQDAESNSAKLQAAVTHQQRWEDEHHKLLQLIDKKNLLEKENSDLKVEIEKFRHGSHPGYEKEKADAPHSHREDVLVGLKNEVNQLKFEYEDLGDEIVQHTYNSNSASTFTESESTDSSAENKVINQLTADLKNERAESEKWRHLYEAEKKNNSKVDAHSCITLCKQLNSSVNQYINVTALLSALHNVSHSVADSVKDMKDILFSEVKQNFESVKKSIFEEESEPETGYHGEHDDDDDDDDDDDEKPDTSSNKRHWINTVSEVLNKTRNSVVNVSRQIQDTWVHVKNLSESFWKKYEPSFVEAANKMSKKVADMGRKFKDKIEKKASRWFKRHSNHDERWQKKTQSKMEKPFGKKNDGDNSKTSSEHMNDENFRNEWDERTGREELRDERYMMKAFVKIVKKMDRITVKKHSRMSSGDISKMCAMFSRFARMWDVDKWLSDTNRAWFICQSEWWADRRDGIKRNLRGCGHCLKDWQLDWEPSSFQRGSQKNHRGGKRSQRCGQGNKKMSRNCNEKNQNKHHDTSQHQPKYHQEDNTEYHERRPYHHDNRHKFKHEHHYKHGNKRHHHHEGNPHHHHYYHESEFWEEHYDPASLHDDVKTMEHLEDPKENPQHHDYHHRSEFSEGDDPESLYDHVENMEHFEDTIFWNLPKDGCKKHNKTFWWEEQQDWYLELGKHRLAQLEDEHKSDWMFDRAADRKIKRSSTSQASQKTFAKPVDQEFRTAYIDPKSEWLFSRADDRDFRRSAPENWYFERSEYRTKKNNFNFDS